MLEGGSLRLVGHRALRDLRQLVRIAEQHEVPRRVADRDDVGERDLARLVDDQRVEEAGEVLAREEPRRARDELELLVEQVAPVVARVDELALEAGVPARGLLAALEREALPPRLPLDPGEEVRDRLVAERRDADAAARAHERDRRLRALPRLPRAGRALDEEVAAVERERGLGHRAGRAARAGAAARGSPTTAPPRSPSRYDCANRWTASRWFQSGIGFGGMSAAGSGSSARAFAAPERHGPALVVRGHDVDVLRPRVDASVRRSCAPAAGT